MSDLRPCTDERVQSVPRRRRLGHFCGLAVGMVVGALVITSCSHAGPSTASAKTYVRQSICEAGFPGGFQCPAQTFAVKLVGDCAAVTFQAAGDNSQNTAYIRFVSGHWKPVDVVTGPN